MTKRLTSHLRLYFSIWALSLPLLAQEKIQLQTPLPDSETLAGEVSFSWTRPIGDKSSVTLEVQKMPEKKVMLERPTIGTRRTLWLTPGEFRWRLKGNNKIASDSWQNFRVTETLPKEQAKSVSIVTEPRPIDRFKEQQSVVNANRERLQKAHSAMKFRINKIQSPKSRLKELQSAATELIAFKEAMITKPIEYAAESVEENAAMQAWVEGEIKNFDSLVAEEQKILKEYELNREWEMQVGRKPVIAENAGGMVPLVRDYILSVSKIPAKVEFSSWSSVDRLEYQDKKYWATRVRFRSYNSFGELVEQEKIALIQQDKVHYLLAPEDL